MLSGVVHNVIQTAHGAAQTLANRGVYYRQDETIKERGGGGAPKETGPLLPGRHSSLVPVESSDPVPPTRARERNSQFANGRAQSCKAASPRSPAGRRTIRCTQWQNGTQRWRGARTHARAWRNSTAPLTPARPAAEPVHPRRPAQIGRIGSCQPPLVPHWWQPWWWQPRKHKSSFCAPKRRPPLEVRGGSLPRQP